MSICLTSLRAFIATFSVKAQSVVESTTFLCALTFIGFVLKASASVFMIVSV